MSDEELKQEQEPEEGAEDALDQENEELNTEWLGEEEWGDEEDEDEIIEEDVPTFLDNGDGTISDTGNNLMWAKSDSYAEFKYGINWFEAQDYCESLNEKEFAGFDDWRLCSTEEAKSMFSFAMSNTDKDGAEIHVDELFEEGGGHNTWTYMKNLTIISTLSCLVMSQEMKCGSIRITSTHMFVSFEMLGVTRTTSQSGVRILKSLSAESLGVSIWRL